jgi:hypothetical protein
MIARICVIAGIVLCALALFGGHVVALAAPREVALGAGLIGVAVFLGRRS